MFEKKTCAVGWFERVCFFFLRGLRIENFFFKRHRQDPSHPHTQFFLCRRVHWWSLRSSVRQTGAVVRGACVPVRAKNNLPSIVRQFCWLLFTRDSPLTKRGRRFSVSDSVDRFVCKDKQGRSAHTWPQQCANGLVRAQARLMDACSSPACLIRLKKNTLQ